MRILKLILISVVVLFAVTTFLFILFPSHIRISRVIIINSSQDKIANIIGDLKSWEKWNLFINRPGIINKTISSPSFGKKASLVSDQFRVTITEFLTDSIKTDWQGDQDKEFEAGFRLVPTSKGNTTVQWWFDFNFRWYPWEKLGSMFYDKQFGPLMEQSLLNLKQLVENN